MVCSQTCVPCRAVPGWCTRPGRERGGTSALVNIPLQPHDVGALGVGHGRTDFPGDRQTYRDVLRTEAVRAALLEEEAEAGVLADFIHLVAHAAFAGVTDAAGARG